MSSEFPEEFGFEIAHEAKVTIDGPEHAVPTVIELSVPDGAAATDEGAVTLSVESTADADFGELPSQVQAADADDSLRNTESVGNAVVAPTEEIDISDDLRYQYGHKVVALAELQTRAILEEDDAAAQDFSEQLAQELTAIRADIAVWNAGLKEPDSNAHYEATGIIRHFNELDRPHLPVTLAHTSSDESGEVPGKLKSEHTDEMGPRLLDWFSTLSDERLINYFQWSEARTDSVSEAMVAQREQIKRNVREDFDYLITDGLAPEDAREALERGFAYTTHFGALSSFESGYYQAAGLFDSEAHRIGIMREYEADEAQKYTHHSHRALFHEDLHALDAANDMGLIYLESEDEEPLTWVNEAVKEHLTLAAMHGQSDALDPADRSDAGAYGDLRELLHLVLTGGSADIAITEVTAANFERRGAAAEHRANLAARLRESYRDEFPDMPEGETIFHVIAREFNAATKPQQSAVAQRWLEKMYEIKGVELLSDLSVEPATDRATLTIVLGG